MNRYLRHLAKSGVIIEGEPHIDSSATIERGAVIEDGACITGNSIVRSGARIGRYSVIDDATIDRDTIVENSVISHAYIGVSCTVGPYAHVHRGAVLGGHNRVGNFVEIKNSNIGVGTKMAHLAYIGDVDIGERCNIGCGAIFVNYDGVTKRRSKVGDGVFVGSNVNVIAPVTLADGAYIAAGSTVTISLDENALCIARAREVVKADRSIYKPFKGDKHE